MSWRLGRIQKGGGGELTKIHFLNISQSTFKAKPRCTSKGSIIWNFLVISEETYFKFAYSKGDFIGLSN